jgi:hypothetical protein
LPGNSLGAVVPPMIAAALLMRVPSSPFMRLIQGCSIARQHWYQITGRAAASRSIPLLKDSAAGLHTESLFCRCMHMIQASINFSFGPGPN